MEIALIIIFVALAALATALYFKFVQYREVRTVPRIPKSVTGTVIVNQYDTPDNLSPIEVGGIFDLQVTTADITAVILDLSAQGYITVTPDLTTGDYLFTKVKNYKGGSALYSPIYKFLFDKRSSVQLSQVIARDNRRNINNTLHRLSKNVRNSLIKKGHLVYRFTAARSVKYIAMVVALAVLYAVFYYVPMDDVWASVIATPFLLLIMIVTLEIETAIEQRNGFGKLTPQGEAALIHILGFRQYLQTAEKERLYFHDAPQSEHRTNTPLLPYAVALGIVPAWGDAFKSIRFK